MSFGQWPPSEKTRMEAMWWPTHLADSCEGRKERERRKLQTKRMCVFFLAKEGTVLDKRKVVLNGVEGTVTLIEAFQRDGIFGEASRRRVTFKE